MIRNFPKKLKVGPKEYRASTSSRTVEPKPKKQMTTWQPVVIEMTTFPLKLTTPQIGELLMRDEHTNELYKPIKRKEEMLYFPLDSQKGPTKDTLLDSESYVSVTAENE